MTSPGGSGPYNPRSSQSGTGGYPGQAGAYPPGTPAPTNGTAIAALVFSLLIPPVGVILGYMAKAQIGRTHEGGAGLAKAALIIGLIFTLTPLVIVAVLVAGAGLVWFRTPEAPTGPLPPATSRPAAGGGAPSAASQDASCPDVQAIIIPGTGESSAQDDPSNPGQYPQALLLAVSRPIAQQFGSDRVHVMTVPYAAQFHNPLASDQQMSYNDSRKEGARNAIRAITDVNTRCPLTSFFLAGFSQGAVIAGDVASDIGNGRGPIGADRVLGATLISDLRRQTGVGQTVGPNTPGEGAEVVLANVSALNQLGLSMTGPRAGGFGSLNDRVNEICAAGDTNCAATPDTNPAVNLPVTLTKLTDATSQSPASLYATTQAWSVDGQPAIAWTLNWATNLVANAPHPAH